MLAIAAIVMLLGGSLTTEGAPTNNPESERADRRPGRARSRRIPDGGQDIVVIRSDEYTVDAPQFEAFVRSFVEDDEIPRSRRRAPISTTPSGALVSADRHATIVPIALLDDDETEALVEKVEARRRGERVRRVGHRRGDARPRLQPPLAGGSRERRAQVRAPGRADHPAARLRRRRGRARPAPDGDRLDRRRPRAHARCSPSSSSSRSSSSTCSRAWGSRSGSTTPCSSSPATARNAAREARARARSRPRVRPRAGPCSSAAPCSSSPCSGCCSSRTRSCAASRSARSSSGSSPSSRRLTLLPALLGLLGDRVNALRIPFVGKRLARRREPGGPLLGRDRPARPAPPGAQPRALGRRSCCCSPLPVLGMDVGTSGVSALPDRFASKQGFVALERDFPDDDDRPGRDRRRRERVERRTSPRALAELRTTPRGRSALRRRRDRRSADGEVAVLSVPVAGRPFRDRGGRRRSRAPHRDRAGSLRRARTPRSSSAARPRRTSTTSTPSSTPRRT